MSDPADAVHAVQEAVDSESDYLIELTRSLVRVPSVNPKFQADPELNREAEVQDILEIHLKNDGFSTERWDVFENRPNLASDWPGSEDRSLILNGHVDVVPVGDAQSWHSDPFSGDVKEGRIWGRGAVDMKGGVAACVAAAHAIRKCGISLEGRLSIHTVVDEEAGGFGSIDMVKSGRLAKRAIVAEPTWGNVVPAEGGLSWVRVTLFGKQAHAGWRFNSIWPQPQTSDRLEPGVNAIELANRFLNALKEFEAGRCRENWHPLMPPGLTTINPGVIHGGAGMGADGNPVIMTNAAMIPDVATILLDYKFMPNEAFDDVKAEFDAFVHHFSQMDSWLRDHPPKVDWDVFDLHFPPVDTPADDPLVQSLLRRGQAIQRTAPQMKGFEAVTDAAHYAGSGVVPVLYGPSGDGFHGDNECVEIPSLIETTKVIAAAVIDACGVK